MEGSKSVFDAAGAERQGRKIGMASLGKIILFCAFSCFARFFIMQVVTHEPLTRNLKSPKKSC
jgi:hypothetical protein